MSPISRMLNPCVISIALTMVSWVANSSVARAGQHIMNNGTAKCLAIHSESPEEPVIQEECSETYGQNWSLSVLDGISRLQNTEGGLCMAATGLENSSPVVMRPCDDPSTGWQRRLVNMNFDIFSLLTIDVIVIEILGFPVSVHACLDLENGNRNSGVPLQVWSCNFQTNNQVWRFIFIN